MGRRVRRLRSRKERWILAWRDLRGELTLILIRILFTPNPNPNPAQASPGTPSPSGSYSASVKKVGSRDSWYADFHICSWAPPCFIFVGASARRASISFLVKRTWRKVPVDEVLGGEGGSKGAMALLPDGRGRTPHRDWG